ncbi:MAG: TIR domain-containing protein [Leptolyngbya sp. SIO3F4]|nr:TIR domain-containing protein [Leptolyngbya sp. SIO3F4]
MSEQSQQRVFLCHNSKDKPEVRRVYSYLGNRLQGTNISPWMDESDFEPFKPWEGQLNKIMAEKPIAAIFFGSSGLGSYQVKEVKNLIKNKRFQKMGLVILPSCSIESTQSLQLEPALMDQQWVNFHEEAFDPLEKLVWGITDERPETISISELEQRKLNLLDKSHYQARLEIHRDNLALTAELFEIAERKAGSKLDELKKTLNTKRKEKTELDHQLIKLGEELKKGLNEGLRGIVEWLEYEERLVNSAGESAQQETGLIIADDASKKRFYFSIKTLIERIKFYFLDPKRDPVFLLNFDVLYLPPRAPSFIIDLYAAALNYVNTRIQKAPYPQGSKQEVNSCIEELIKNLEACRY